MRTDTNGLLENSRKLTNAPIFSIVTVSYNDAWALTKTARSVFCQNNSDFEYIVVDGGSSDGTRGLIQFWSRAGLIDRSLIEPDRGVYDAMNKAMGLAQGKYICYMNAGDVFSHDNVLNTVRSILSSGLHDGCLGWGELHDSVWTSWIESEAFKLASLGFCHQALFVKTDLLKAHKFDSAPSKTDSDTLQLSRLYASGARIPIIPEVWAKRGGEPGISSDLERSKKSIIGTLTSEYPEIDATSAEGIVNFRRTCDGYEQVLRTMERATEALGAHLALMILDTLFLRQSRNLSQATVDTLTQASFEVLLNTQPDIVGDAAERLITTQKKKATWLHNKKVKQEKLDDSIREFRKQEDRRKQSDQSSKKNTNGKYSIFLTTFPPRLNTLEFVIRSLVNQSAPPLGIHIVIGRDEIPNRGWLPSSLLKWEDFGLEIHFADKTSHQYDKFLHLCDLNRNAPYVIVDDDVLYPQNSMEHLLEGHALFPHAVIGNRCHFMAYNRQEKHFSPYTQWVREQRLEEPSHTLMPTGAGGVLYPPTFFSADWVKETETILAVAPYADDVWLKLCSIVQDRPTYATPLSAKGSWYYRYTPTMTEGTLMATNVDRGLNDLQIRAGEAWLDRVKPDWRKHFAESPILSEAAI